jgi:hypothetical protein
MSEVVQLALDQTSGVAVLVGVASVAGAVPTGRCERYGRRETGGTLERLRKERLR